MAQIQPENIDNKYDVSCNTNFTKVFCSCPYTKKTYTNCCIGCDKPGLESPRHDPYDNNCSSDCAIFCCPCAFITDIITYPYELYKQLTKDNWKIIER